MKYDEVGYWSEIKLQIVKKYAAAYSRILAKQKALSHAYIDAFAGAGTHISKQTKAFIKGSPLNALAVDPPFQEFYLIDIDQKKIAELKKAVSNHPGVHVYGGDCNQILLEDVFPRVRFSDFKRALCLLDPYGLHLNWEVIKCAADSRSIEIFLNFPVMDMNMNVLWRAGHEKVDPGQILRMTDFWGDNTWKDATYTKSPGLFGDIDSKADNDAIAQAFKRRLHKVAGFGCVLDPMPMRNTKGSIVYYLFFAAHKPVAATIVSDIFDAYKDRKH